MIEEKPIPGTTDSEITAKIKYKSGYRGIEGKGGVDRYTGVNPIRIRNKKLERQLEWLDNGRGGNGKLRLREFEGAVSTREVGTLAKRRNNAQAIYQKANNYYRTAVAAKKTADALGGLGDLVGGGCSIAGLGLGVLALATLALGRRKK